MNKKREVIHSQIWEEIPEGDNPFAAAICYCSGYDVYGDLLGKISWIGYLYLLFKQERPTSAQAKLLEGLAIAVAILGPRDLSVRAAMCAGVGGSSYASCLMPALSAVAGQLTGAQEVALAMAYWQECDQRLTAWRERLQHLPQEERADVWLPLEHPPGFDPHGVSCAMPVRQTLASFAKHSPGGGALAWLQDHRLELEAAANCPLAMTGVAAAAMIDLDFSIQERSEEHTSALQSRGP